MDRSYKTGEPFCSLIDGVANSSVSVFSNKKSRFVANKFAGEDVRDRSRVFVGRDRSKNMDDGEDLSFEGVDASCSTVVGAPLSEPMLPKLSNIS